MSEDENEEKKQNKLVDFGIKIKKCIFDNKAASAVIVIIVILAIVISSIDSCGSSSNKPDWAKNYKDSEFVTMAESAVKAKANYPSTVKFSWAGDVIYMSETVYVTGSFSAKNGFGLQTSYNYRVTISVGSNGKPSVDSCSITEKS